VLMLGSTSPPFSSRLLNTICFLLFGFTKAKRLLA